MQTSPETDSAFCDFVASFIKDWLKVHTDIRPTVDDIYEDIMTFMSDSKDVEKYIEQKINLLAPSKRFGYVSALIKEESSFGHWVHGKQPIDLDRLEPIVQEFVNNSTFNIFNWDFDDHYNQQRHIKSRVIEEYLKRYPDDEIVDYNNTDHDSIDDILDGIFKHDNPPFNWDVVIQQWHDCEHELNGSVGHAISDSTIDNYIIKNCMYDYEDVYDNTYAAYCRAKKWAPNFMKTYNVPKKYKKDIIQLLKESIEYGPG